MNDSEAFSRLKGVVKSPLLQLNIVAAITGASAAILTWIFISMTGVMQNLFYGNSLVHNNVSESDTPWLIIFIPALGGLIAGFIIEYWSREAKGVGVPLVMEAVAFKQARLSAKQGLAKCAAAITSVGTGMSLGRVGPMVVISSMIGSRGLGEQVLLGIQKLDVGKGFTAGIGIVILAIVIDRLTQEFGKKLDKSINH